MLMISLSGLSTLVSGATDLSYIRRAHVYVLGSHFSASLPAQIDFSSLSSFTRAVKKLIYLSF